MATTLEQYNKGIEAALADDNAEAAEELRQLRDSEYPPAKSANAGDARKTRRKAARTKRQEEAMGPNLSKYDGISSDRLLKGFEAAKKAGDQDAADELAVVVGIKRAEEAGDDEAAAELKGMLGGRQSEQTIVQTRRKVEDRRQTIKELENIPPQDLTPEQGQRLRSAYEEEQRLANEEVEAADNRIIEDIDVAAGGLVNFFENFTGTGDEMYGIGSVLGASAYDLLNSDRSVDDILGDAGMRFEQGMETGREKKRRFEEAKPAANIAGDVLGTAAQMAGSAAAFGKIPLSNSLGKRIMQGAGIAGAEGAALGFLEGDTLENRAKGAAIGGAAGGALGLGLGGAIEGVAARRAARAAGAGRAEREGINDLAEGAEREAIARAEAEAELNSPADQYRKFREEQAQERETRQLAQAEQQERLGSRVEEGVRAANQATRKAAADADIKAETQRLQAESPEAAKLLEELSGGSAPTARQLYEAKDYEFLLQYDERSLRDTVEAEVAEALRTQGNRINIQDTGLPRGNKVKQEFDRALKRLENATPQQLDEIAGDVARRGLSDRARDAELGARGVLSSVTAVIKPITALWKKEVGAGVAGALERALVRTIPIRQQIDDIAKEVGLRWVAQLEGTDIVNKRLKAHLLNMTNHRLDAEVRANSRNAFIREMARATKRSEESVGDLLKRYEQVRTLAVDPYNKLVGAGRLRAEDSIHTQLKPKDRKRLPMPFKRSTPKGIGRDEALQQQQRPLINAANLDLVDDYQNPFLTDNRWLKERTQDAQIADVLKLRGAETAKDLELALDGGLVKDRLRELVISQGGNNDTTLRNLDDLLETTLESSLEGVGPLLSILRSTNIAMGLANPKSAVLNLSEPLIMALENDISSILRAYSVLDDVPFTAKELGLASVMAGDELRRIAAKASGDVMTSKGATMKVVDFFDSLAQTSMKYSGFEAAALGAQNVQMKAAINQATSIVKKGIKSGKITKEALDEFDSRYGTWFSKAEQAKLMRIFQKLDAHGETSKLGRLTKTEGALLRDFQLATLNDWQPLSAMGRSYINNRYPMVRPFLLFTTYTTRMHEAIARQAVRHLDESRKLRSAGKTGAANAELSKAVFSYIGRLMYSQALWAVTNQTRQLIAGKGLKELMDIAGAPIDSEKEADEWDDFDSDGLMEDFFYGLFSQATGGILPANKLGYMRGSSALSKAETPLDYAKAAGLYGYDAVQEVMVPTFILGEALQKSEERDNYRYLIERTPIVGPTIIKTMRKYGED